SPTRWSAPPTCRCWSTAASNTDPKEVPMNTASTQSAPARLTLHAETAADLMTPNPVSIRQDAPFHAAARTLVERGISGSAVTDEAGRPVGVISQTDLVTHERESAGPPPRYPEYYTRAELETVGGVWQPRGCFIEGADRTTVADVMTPAVFSVPPD